MDPLEEQLAQLSMLNNRALPQRNNYSSDNSQIYHNDGGKKIAPIVPPKPEKKIQQIRESLYASCKDMKPPLLSRPSDTGIYHKPNKETLDNPAVLEQKLEALAYHKQQLDKKKNQHHQQQQHNFENMPKLSSSSLVYKELRPKQYSSNNIYTNFNVAAAPAAAATTATAHSGGVNSTNIYGNILQKAEKQTKLPMDQTKRLVGQSLDPNNYKLYCNVPFEKPTKLQQATATTMPLTTQMLSMQANEDDFHREHDELPPPSPVSSSYSELRRATNIFQNTTTPAVDKTSASPTIHYVDKSAPRQANPYGEVYVDNSTSNEFSNYSLNLEGGSSTYESIYEPINPRPSSQLSARFNYLNYSPYENAAAIVENNAAANMLNNTNFSSLPRNSSNYPPEPHQNIDTNHAHNPKADTLTNYLDPTIDEDTVENEHYGICYKCNQRVIDETSGCTAMDQIYHIACFTCFQCQINLQGKPFYGIEGKPYCEYDYLQTLEKCSVCMKPILERILRATGKPYHPQCFTCVVCGNSLDGIPFTVDATNQNYCIEDFHKKFAPRCCVCKEPIMPEPGEEETVRVVALDRSFHFQCYKCEDCGLLLSSEAEGRGCYPLDDHVLCKSCNARRVQLLTNRMTTEL